MWERRDDVARRTMTLEIVETRYPLYDDDLKALISKVYAAHKGKADVDDRLIDAIWKHGYAEFRNRNIEASQGDAETSALAERGELTPAGRAAIRAYLDDAQDFDAGLQALSDRDLAAKYDEICGPEQSASQARRRERGLNADLLAFFSRANATADSAHWCALPVWSAEEATALSFGKDPRRVNVATLRAYTNPSGSPFRDAFMARLDQIERALRAKKKLRDPLQPLRFLQWAIAQGMEPPPDLVAHIPVKGGSRADYDVREIHTLFKILLGLAIKHYNYDPTLEDGEEQSGVFEKLVEDLGTVDAATTAPTLRKALKQAREWAIRKPHPLVKRARRNKAAATPRAAVQR